MFHTLSCCFYGWLGTSQSQCVLMFPWKTLNKLMPDWKGLLTTWSPLKIFFITFVFPEYFEYLCLTVSAYGTLQVRWTFSYIMLKNGEDTLKILQTRHRSSHKRSYIKKGVLKNFAKFTGKCLCQTLFFNKVAGWNLHLY